ncbi:MAG: putative peptide zinc metalloprotease protein, partial [Actinomycetota bacterium]|nr:putative peptide zinc metalloprotease protein [Actinomycetota bacterium]
MAIADDPTTAEAPATSTVAGGTAMAGTERPPQLADGVELIGDYGGSGFKEPPSLVRRNDGQVIQLTELLYLVAKYSDGSRDADAIGAKVTE